ncbi:MAG: MCP four helix bundle domain-containing protein [Verrucomicrobiia bacterium]|jgi:methyl-accepting chemotaxis protein
MNYLQRLKPVVVAAGILLIIGGVEFLAVNQLKIGTGRIVLDTLPGLSYAGKINAEVSGNFIRTLLAINSTGPEERAAYTLEIDEASREINGRLKEYEKTIHEPKERQLFNTLLEQRKKYTEVRRAVFGLIDGNQKEEALRLFKTALLPAYKEYTRTGDLIFSYNMQQGDSRGKHILTVCNTTQLLVVVIGIIIFIGGFLTPFIAICFLPDHNR